MTEDERCQHPDCRYRNNSDPETSGRCHFWMLTGQSRLKGLHGKEQLPCNCPRYKPDGSRLPKRDDDWKQLAFKLYRAGATDREILQATGRPRSTIQNWRRRNKLPINPDRLGPTSAIDWKAAEELYRQGKNDREIAQAIGCSGSNVRRWRWKHELLPNAYRNRKERKAK